MKFNFKKAISFILCLCLISSFCLTSISRASSFNEASDSNIKVVCNDDEVCTVSASYEGSEIYATLNKTTLEITAQIVEKTDLSVFGISLGQDRITNYNVEVVMLTEDAFSAIVTDIDSGSEFKVSKNSGKVIAQVYPVIYYIIGEALYQALLQAGKAVIVAGVTWFALDRIYDKLKEKNYEYYACKIENGIVWVTDPISKSAARDRLLDRLDILALTQAKAIEVCNLAIAKDRGVHGYKLTKKERHGDSPLYFYHFHISEDPGRAHAFFLV